MSGKNPFLGFGFVSPFITFIRASISKNLFLGANLDLNFTENLSLIDDISGTNLITFSRASSGTYVDSDGLIKTTPVNYKINSEEVDTFLLTQVTVAANQFAAPNGTLTADRVDITTANSSHQLTVGTSVLGAISSTTSVYVKGISNVTQVQLRASISGGRASAVYDLVNVTSEAFRASNVIFADSSITPAGNDWYRISLTFTTSGANASGVFLNFTDGNADPEDDRNGQQFVGTNESIAVWGAQVEKGLVMNDYIPTGATISGAPRFDHDPATGESLGLLIEESRTNLVTYSEQFDQWDAGSNTTITTNAIAAPDGSMTADRIELPASGGTYIQQTNVITAGAEYTGSVWVKAVTPGINNQFNLQYGGNSASSTAFTATGDWQRISSTVTAALGGSFSINNRPDTYITDVYIWGAQVEAGSFPTSYIPTNSSTVTRATDVATIEGTNFSSWYNQSEGTVFIDAKNYPHPVTGKALVPFAFSDNTYNNRITLSGSTSTAQFNFDVTAAGSLQRAILGNFVSSGLKASGGYKSTGSAGSLDGAATVTSNTPNIPSVIGQMDIGGPHDGSNILNGHIKRLAYFPTRKTDQELIKITGGTLDPAIITYGITSAGGVFNLRSTGTVDYAVDWDSTGGYESSTSNTLPHTYTAGDYDLVVYSDGVYRPDFDNVTADANQITSVVIGPGADLGTDLSKAWQGASNMTSFVCPFDVTSGVTSFNTAWRGCSSLTSFPLIDTSSGTNFSASWRGCGNLTSFPLIDTSSAVTLTSAWRGCSSLTSFPANMFDTTGTLNSNAFNGAWTNSALSAQSIENILVSLDTNGQSNIGLSINGGTNAAKTTWSTAANTAYTNLINKGWTISFNA